MNAFQRAGLKGVGKAFARAIRAEHGPKHPAIAVARRLERTGRESDQTALFQMIERTLTEPEVDRITARIEERAAPAQAASDRIERDNRRLAARIVFKGAA